MLSHKITHYTDDDDDAETGVFYDTLISRIDEMTHIANANGNAIELEWDEKRSYVKIYRSSLPTTERAPRLTKRSRPYKRHQH